MKIWIERALAALRWVWGKFVPFAKAAWAKLTAWFDTIYDPPPRTIRFWFWSWAALMLVAWLTFAFTNSWFYRPTVEFFATLGEDGDVFIPDHLDPLPPVATPAETVPAVEVVCHDMSDTPHCEPLPAKAASEGKREPLPYSKPDKSAETAPIVEDAIRSRPVARPKAYHQNKKKVNRRKPQPYVTYWGF